MLIIGSSELRLPDSQHSVPQRTTYIVIVHRIHVLKDHSDVTDQKWAQQNH